MEEIWKDVVGYEGLYQVSNLGNIRNQKGNILKAQKRKHGYLCVWLYGRERSAKRAGKQFSIHRIVAEAFVQNPNGCAEVNHIDECKQNNRADNLEWCTHQENSTHGTRPNRIGEKHRNNPNKKRRPIAQYTKSGELVRIYPSITSLRQTKFNAGNAYKCATGDKSYSHSQGYIWRFVEE